MADFKEKVVLQRKQPREYVVNFPRDGSVVSYQWLGTRGDLISEREVPREVYEWLFSQTDCLKNGDLIVKETEYEDEDIKINRQFIEDIEDIEQTTLTRKEIIEILTTGNQNVLKGKLKKLTDGKSEIAISNIQREVRMIASEVGIDSSAKRKVICQWLGLDYEMYGDTLFDKGE